ncbi:putative glycosyltransferase [Acorus calamus]|uniref:Glycosyltransferase n=1 Tax=Acorus calamus TaxID=4465 RepID=A0AAV9DZC1_ACOCL|nr:putative glycosyltransferase [Acorus calamus]
MRGASNGASNNLKKTEFEIQPIENKTSPTQTEVTRRTKRLEPHVMSRIKFERVESDLARARDDIRKASKYNMNQSYISEDDKDYVPSGLIYRNAHQFHRSYLEMEKRFKIHVYEEGEPPLLHHGPCRGIYSIEGKFIHDIEKRTPLRTRDPERAHVHFLPFSISNMVKYLFEPNKTRGYGPIKRVVEDYVGVVSRKYPYWNRTLGADHFMLSCHDWGPETSKAVPDLFNHSIRVLCNANTSEGFNPSKDASLPEIKLYGGPPDVIGRALPPSSRPILAFFAGHIDGPVRPILLHHWKGKDGAMQVHDLLPNNISYNDMMSKSKFCLCPSGYEVASPRIVEAIYAGCVPVTMSDYYVLPFSDVLNYKAFSIDIPVAEIRNLKKVLMGVSQEEYLRLYEGVREVKRHFVVNEMPKRFDVFHMILHSIWLRRLNVRIRVD